MEDANLLALEVLVGGLITLGRPRLTLSSYILSVFYARLGYLLS